MQFFTYLKKHADDYGISIHKLEQRCGLSNGTIRNWDTADPGVSKCYRVAKFFGMTVDELIGRVEAYEDEQQTHHG